jgi:hypothetical protein
VRCRGAATTTHHEPRWARLHLAQRLLDQGLLLCLWQACKRWHGGERLQQVGGQLQLLLLVVVLLLLLVLLGRPRRLLLQLLQVLLGSGHRWVLHALQQPQGCLLCRCIHALLRPTQRRPHHDWPHTRLLLHHRAERLLCERPHASCCCRRRLLAVVGTGCIVGSLARGRRALAVCVGGGSTE